MFIPNNRAIKCLKFVPSNFKYVSDEGNFKPSIDQRVAILGTAPLYQLIYNLPKTLADV